MNLTRTAYELAKQTDERVFKWMQIFNSQQQ